MAGETHPPKRSGQIQVGEILGYSTRFKGGSSVHGNCLDFLEFPVQTLPFHLHKRYDCLTWLMRKIP